jgi:glycosyltransferase involved in cell wall biosynthesis
MLKYNIPKGYTLFTFTGRLNPEKGVKELLLAYKKAQPEKSKLIIAGSYFFGSNMKSEYEIELAEIAKVIGNDIIFTGNVDYCDMPLLYHISDVIVLPSIWNDPAPLTIIESITCGKPLITTNSRVCK